MATELDSPTMLLHSHRSGAVILRSETAAPSTCLYLLSHPLPPNIIDLRITILSCNQGFCDDPVQGSWTWFEASVLRRGSEDAQLDLSDLSLPRQVRNRPEDFEDDIKGRGWHFVPLLQDCLQHAEIQTPAAVSLRILTIPVSREWQSQEVTWSPGVDQAISDPVFNGHGLVRLLEAGDRLAIWARVQVGAIHQKPTQQIANVVVVS